MKKIKNTVTFFLAFFLFLVSVICSDAYAIASFTPVNFQSPTMEQSSPIASAMSTYMQMQEIQQAQYEQAMMQQRIAQERQRAFDENVQIMGQYLKKISSKHDH